ncbi:phosphotransferase system IIB component [Mycoplasmoides fastidiosum]|uniref:Phosphotransferase system IIB component n=1 Tax=Mycoplasmoides fastidiosum TaxID=92758 RepID=A0ABU0LYA8_9BACT|nr:hypothetical protein [Mycoplasmoides fastidiosum]MDQ0513694.1 phosphotransferase system IIB component [Mycoplasmoides fastidiosum]UUD37883.1 hypothetical protein NPA10_00600 [Mycoplasmoides fastidiosum]
MKFLRKWFWKIITFNGRFFTKKQALLEAKTVRNELKTSETTTVDITAMIQALGGVKNIANISAVVNTISVELKAWEAVQLQELQALGAKGLMRSDLKLRMVFGDDSHTIVNLIEQQMHNETTK